MIKEDSFNSQGLLWGWHLYKTQEYNREYFECSSCKGLIKNCSKSEINRYYYCPYCGHYKGSLGLGDC